MRRGRPDWLPSSTKPLLSLACSTKRPTIADAKLPKGSCAASAERKRTRSSTPPPFRTRAAKASRQPFRYPSRSAHYGFTYLCSLGARLSIYASNARISLCERSNPGISL